MSEAETEVETEVEVEVEEKDDLTPVEREQMQHGWTPEEQWVADGNDPAKWRSAEHFKQIGENVRLRRERDTMTADYERRIANIESLSKNAQEAIVEELEGKRDAATADGDVEKSREIQTRIDKAKEAPEETGGVDPLISEWEDRNPWILNPTPKSQYAQALYSKGTKSGMNTADIIEMVDREVEREYPATSPRVNPRREEPSTTTKGAKPKGGGGERKLTMGDLTQEEKRMLGSSSIMSGWSEEKQLDMVKRSRAENE